MVTRRVSEVPPAIPRLRVGLGVMRIKSALPEYGARGARSKDVGKDEGVDLGYHRLPRRGMVGLGIAVNPNPIFHQIQSRTFSIIFGIRLETIPDDGVLSGHQC